MEQIRWPKGTRCVHCNSERVTRMPPVVDRRRLKKREGLYHCKDCRKQFTVTVGTILKNTHLPLSKVIKLIEALDSENQIVLKAAKKTGTSYKVAHALHQKMKESGYVCLEDVLQGNSCIEYYTRFSSMLLGKQHDEEELQAGVILLVHIIEKPKSLEEFAEFTGYDPKFIEEIARNYIKNELWAPNLVMGTDSWVDCIKHDKNDKHIYVSFALHVLCGLGFIERTWKDAEAIYNLPKEDKEKGSTA